MSPDRGWRPSLTVNSLINDMALELRPNCECCDRDLPPESREAYICTFECTYCLDCASNKLGFVCANCGGELVRRPIRPSATLRDNPASTVRVVRTKPCNAPHPT